MRPVSSWGRLSAPLHNIISLWSRDTVGAVIHDGPHPGIAHGIGRSYGDVALNPGGTLWATTGLDHLISFDVGSGRLVCEAGAVLGDIQRVAIPQGWMLPVTPGTQFVTVGGAIANDVHGKNHHIMGTFGSHLKHLTLARTDGETIPCGPETNEDWFAATVGGLGLTGVITDAEIQLRRVPGPWLETETVPYSGLSEFFQLADGSENGWEYTVSWIDCLSKDATKGLFLRANHIENHRDSVPRKRPLSVPFVPPVSLVNRLTLRPFNTTYYHLKKRHTGRVVSHYEPFFYPLDNILDWNRMYGPKGFFQYQSVVPREAAQGATQAMLRAIADSGEGSFLAVLKTFGKHLSPGMLSFPRPGVTLALDFPNNGERTSRLFERLDAIVSEAKGCIYPAKDARMPRALFESGYPRLLDFLAYRDSGISSGLSRRLMGS